MSFKRPKFVRPKRDSTPLTVAAAACGSSCCGSRRRRAFALLLLLPRHEGSLRLRGSSPRRPPAPLCYSSLAPAAAEATLLLCLAGLRTERRSQSRLIRAIGPAAAEEEEDELLIRYASSLLLHLAVRALASALGLRCPRWGSRMARMRWRRCGDLEEEVAAA